MGRSNSVNTFLNVVEMFYNVITLIILIIFIIVFFYLFTRASTGGVGYSSAPPIVYGAPPIVYGGPSVVVNRTTTVQEPSRAPRFRSRR